ncbi:putative carboxylesterase 6 [Vitis vinifera]|uniref:Putative carboxylesterase 6 n=1 Tax=Vitis vinifera TaxID=29760 RepID=A0A438KFA9_VITVI|nr:putative carboxylesterase 6 [Vitis vinifera]
MSLVADFPGYFQVFSDGSVKRYERETAPASIDSSSNGYKSKDVIISSTKPISARIFLPDTLDSSSHLPVLVYFHGGGFCAVSTTWLGHHTFLGDFAVASQSIVLSVDYRLAPENRLPIAYDDCYSSLEWLSCQASSDPWLERADLSRVFLSGDSSGGNIVHNERTEKERASGEAENVAKTDLLWKLSLPEGSNRDHPWCNFEKAELSRAEWSRYPPVLVYVAGSDFLKERGVMYATFLEKKGVEVKLVEAEGEVHVYHVLHPESKATRLLQKQMSEFIHNF